MSKHEMPSMRRRALLAALAGIGASGVRAQQSDQETFKIGVSGPFSGGSAPLGTSMRNGIRLAAEELNFLGGLLGRRIELLERDDKADPATGKQIAAEFVQRKVAAAIGIVNTGVGVASIDAYQTARIPLMVAVSTGPILTHKYAPPAAPENYIFRVAPTLDLEAVVLASDMRRRGWQRVGVLADSTPYGDAGVAALKTAMQRENVTPAVIERFNVGDKDMSAQLKSARAAGCEGIVLWGIGPELALIARGRLAMGWNVPVMGSWTLSAGNFIEGAANAGEGALMTQTFIQQAGNAERNAFLLEYERNFKESRIPSPMSAAQGYDGMLLLGVAITQADSAEGPAIRAALENIERPVRGVITYYEKPFSARDHDAITTNMIVIGKVDKGRVAYAYEEDARRWLLSRRKQGEASR